MRTITYYDSMRGNGDRYMHHILHYLQDDWQRTRGYDMPNLREWTLKNEKDVPVQDNSYDCGVFVCLFATCMVLDCDMEFDQSDAPMMRMHLAHLIYTHRTTTQQSSEAVQPNPIQEISVLTQETQDPPEETNVHNTGYFTIMQGSKGVKRKFLKSTSQGQQKRRKPNPRHSSKSNPYTRSNSPVQQQPVLTTMFPYSQSSRHKRKMSITDEEHPFKHKRFKEDDES
jgi:hypothetical protein